MWALSGIAVIVLGFLIGLNPLLVVAAAALVTGLAADRHPLDILAAFGKAFNENRYVSVVFLVLPAIGLLERAGLQERARQVIGGLRGITAGRLLLLYLLFRQVSAALGLLAIGGHAQMVRPLIAPMAEGAAELHLGKLPTKLHWLVRAFAASADNVGAFFGEDVFVAVGSVLLIVGSLQQSGVMVQPLSVSLWAVPTAIIAFFIHGARLLLLDRRLRNEQAKTLRQGPVE
jgi:uncharacterized membrane protein